MIDAIQKEKILQTKAKTTWKIVKIHLVFASKEKTAGSPELSSIICCLRYKTKKIEILEKTVNVKRGR